MTDKEKILMMQEGDNLILNMIEGGGVQIYMYNHEYLLYEIPIYGGQPIFYDIYNYADVDKMISEYKTWT